MASAIDKDMVGCKAWRRANLAAICAEASRLDAENGLPIRGSGKRMAQRLSLAPAALSNLLHGVKNMGDEAARAIEAALAMRPGSLDEPPYSISFPDAQSVQAAREALLREGL